MSTPTRRVQPGDVVTPRSLATVEGTRTSLPDPHHLLHLQFRRFAGCPVCNLHLQAFSRAEARLIQAGIRELIVFHSSADELRPHTAHLPFAIVADPDKQLYREFGVEASPRAMLDPRAWWPILRAVSAGSWNVLRRGQRLPALVPDGGRYGLPADVLVAPDGRVVASHYGEHVDDHWSVEEVVALGHAWRAREQPSQLLTAAAGRDERRIAYGAAAAGIAALVATSVHHAYGAYVYGTPWRLHVLSVAVPTIAGITALYAGSMRATPAGRWRRIASAALALVVLAIPFAMFGVFEGAYNHLLKNVLYFGGAPEGLLRLLFPPPTYELPNNALFEITGVLQTAPALVSGAYAWAMWRRLWRRAASAPRVEMRGYDGRARAATR